MKTKAAVLYHFNKPLVIEELQIPKLSVGQVLVKIFYSGICHSQLMEWGGKRGPDKHLPHLLGHEASAQVVDIGKGVSKVKKGDRVILTWIKAKGLAGSAIKYRKGKKIINAGPIATFTEYAVVSENRCVKLPKGFALDIASLFGCALLTGAGIVINSIKPKPKATIAIYGIGGIGLSALIATHLYDDLFVIAVDVDKKKLELAKAFKADLVIDSRIQDPVKKIMSLTRGGGVDFAVEACGKAMTIEKAFKSVRPGGGLCVFASHPAFGEKISIDPFDLILGRQLQGSWGGESLPDRDIARFAKLFRNKKLPLEKLITHRYPLAQINQAFKDIENKKVGRALLEIHPYLK